MKNAYILLLVLLCSGCASAVAKHEALHNQLAKPIDCDMAKKQIAQLEEEKIGSGEQFANGIASILPTSVIFNLLSGEYSSRLSLANGKYNKQLDQQIARIEANCNQNKDNQNTASSSSGKGVKEKSNVL